MAPFALRTAFLAALATFASAMYNQSQIVQVQPNSMNDVLQIAGPLSQPKITGLIFDYFALNSNVTAEFVSGEQIKITDTFDISTNVYVPLNPKDVCLIAIHGIGFDSTYWDFSAPGDSIDYSFVSAANAQGYPVMTYDRLGVGKSSQPDGIKVVQSQIQVDILNELVQKLRKGEMGKGLQCRKVVGVGHSFGSIQLVGLTSYYPSAVDAAILTGFSTNSTGQPTTFNALTSTIATSDSKFAGSSLGTEYWTAGSSISAQIGFLHYQNATEAAANAAYAGRQTYTLGEFLTLNVPVVPALTYSGAISIVTGNRDSFFCDGNCYAGPGGTSLLLSSQALWPKASKFATHIVPETGHGINVHTTAPDAYKYILDFVSGLEL